MKKKMLIVEDNDDSRAIFVLMLTNMDIRPYRLRTAKRPLPARRPNNQPSFFMDVGLPDCNGINTSAILKQNRKISHIPIVALTAWMSELWREKASRVGIKTYLLKPISPQTLNQTIEEFTANHLPEEML